MSNKRKKTPQGAYSASREWESLQPQRDEVEAEINKNSVRKIDWTNILSVTFMSPAAAGAAGRGALTF